MTNPVIINRVHAIEKNNFRKKLIRIVVGQSLLKIGVMK